MLLTGKSLGHWFLIAMFAVVLYFCFRIMQPFLIPIVLALILSTLLTPVYDKIAAKLKNRKSLAALLVCIGLTIAIVLPIVLLTLSLAREANEGYQQLKDPETVKKIAAWLHPTTNPLLRRIQPWLPASWKSENLDFSSQLGAQAQRAALAVLGVATGFAAGVFNFLLDYFIMLVVLFFVLRDSAYFAEGARRLSPLSELPGVQIVEYYNRSELVARLVRSSARSSR